MKKKCVAIIVLLGCCLFVTAYTKGEAKNAQADYMVSETDDGSETFETDHGFYTDADDVERAENEPQNEQTDYILHEIDGASEEAETDHGFYTETDDVDGEKENINQKWGKEVDGYDVSIYDFK